MATWKGLHAKLAVSNVSQCRASFKIKQHILSRKLYVISCAYLFVDVFAVQAPIKRVIKTSSCSNLVIIPDEACVIRRNRSDGKQS